MSNYVKRLDCMIGLPDEIVQKPGFESLVEIERQKVVAKQIKKKKLDEAIAKHGTLKEYLAWVEFCRKEN
jgi:hypothetical protein